MKRYTITGDNTMKAIGVSLYETEYEGVNLTVSDGYHTMDELYEHRLALTAALFNFMYGVDRSVRGAYEAGGSNHLYMKSKLHNDGTMFDGEYFIVVALLPDGQISYHYKLEHWDKFKIPEVERIPSPYDGHTSKDVLERLLKL